MHCPPIMALNQKPMDRAMELLAWRLLRRVVGRCTLDMSESVLVSFAALLVFDSQPMLRLRPSCELCDRDECV